MEDPKNLSLWAEIVSPKICIVCIPKAMILIKLQKSSIMEKDIGKFKKIGQSSKIWKNP